jgi:hypothetical protein
VLFTFVKFEGEELDSPKEISFTNTVPAVVPSDFHNSAPEIESQALKYRILPIPRRELRPLALVGAVIFMFKGFVPPKLPSLTNKVEPRIESSA